MNMIIPGIKIGPRDWQDKIDLSQAKLFEVWFRVDKPGWYADMFKYLKSKNVAVGLHFWGMTADEHEPNLAYPGQGRDESIEMVANCLKIASRENCRYVNIHAGNCIRLKLDLNHETLSPDKSYDEIPLVKAEKLQKESLHQLNQYAKSLDITLLVETLPAKVATGSWSDPASRLTPHDQHSIPSLTLFKRGQEGIGITNDICHTFGEHFDQDPQVLWDYCWQTTIKLAPFTRLLHLNTVIPPYNGTDSHHGITPEDFKLAGVMPRLSQLMDILAYFNAIPEPVWAINEPSNDHLGNYHHLQQYLAKIG